MVVVDDDDRMVMCGEEGKGAVLYYVGNPEQLGSSFTELDNMINTFLGPIFSLTNVPNPCQYQQHYGKVKGKQELQVS